MSLRELDLILSEIKLHPFPKNSSLEEARRWWAESTKLLPIPNDAALERVNINGIPGESLQATQNRSESTIIYLHGGGYVMGSANSYRNLAYNLAKASGFEVLVVDYRLASEHPFPAALEDSIQAYRWLRQRGQTAERIAIAGDSAGGGLALATCIALRDKKEDLPAAVISISPWMDLELRGESIQTQAAVDPVCSRSMLEFFRELYVSEGDFSNPLVSPLYGDLSGLPPLLIQVGTEEILLDDSIRLAQRAKEYRLECELKIWEKMIHVWHFFAPNLSEGRDAILEAANFLKKYLLKSEIN